MFYEIQKVSDDDIIQCANILINEYNNNELNEGWTLNNAKSLCKFYQRQQSDLFLVAKVCDEVVGFTFALIKPWAKGYCFLLDEICVKNDYRKQGIASHLLKQSISIAMFKYNIKYIKAETYGGSDEMPFAWYSKLCFCKEQSTFLINGDPKQVIKQFKL